MSKKRIAIIDLERCKYEKCGYACINVCPPQRSGIDVFEKNEKGFPIIGEDLCIGCGLCVKVCPFHAIIIVNLPAPIDEEIVHRYGPNAFALYRLPYPSEKRVLGIVGQNAIGKSTSLKILSGQLKPNLGDYEDPPDWDEIIKHFRGTSLQNYFKKMANGELKVILKPQYVDAIPKVVEGKVIEILEKYDQEDKIDVVIDKLNMHKFLSRDVKHLSGGELQKLAIAIALLREADVYLFDEPSSYLDVLERMRMAEAIRELAEKKGKTVIVAEHDLAILDYISDVISVYYGEPGAFGIVSKPRSVREGINIFLDGYLPDENVRFREVPIKFTIWAPTESKIEKEKLIEYPKMVKQFENFKLEIEPGEINRGEIIGVLGPNGIGKTTYVKILAGKLEPDIGKYEIPEKVVVSYKPQYLAEFVGEDGWKTVREKLNEVRKGILSDQWFKTYIMNPLKLERNLDVQLDELSGGELQKVAIAHALIKKADIYFFDEPSAYISAEDRYWVAKTIKNLVDRINAAIIVVDHDIMLMDYIAEKLLVFEGESGVYGHAKGPYTMEEGMNRFLKFLGITYRRDKHTARPRINKPGSVLDREQKRKNQYYYLG
ncbi:MAG: ribosome biogenesis/translation initiation ATPase RLI [Candidatus Njordarchaeia archaeon]